MVNSGGEFFKRHVDQILPRRPEEGDGEIESLQHPEIEREISGEAVPANTEEAVPVSPVEAENQLEDTRAGPSEERVQQRTSTRISRPPDRYGVAVTHHV